MKKYCSYISNIHSIIVINYLIFDEVIFLYGHSEKYNNIENLFYYDIGQFGIKYERNFGSEKFRLVK